MNLRYSNTKKILIRNRKLSVGEFRHSYSCLYANTHVANDINVAKSGAFCSIMVQTPLKPLK